jgi:sigma-B regulation protein RsbU (phosphoserine phosphatase)
VLFAEDAATVRQLRDAKEPARVYFDDPNSWLYKTPEMTDDERARLAELQPELLLPLSVKDKLLGFISLGQKRSEEPYSPTDLRLLESVAAQTGLALEVARLTTAIGEEMAQRERLNRELEIAREVQQRLFPQTLPSIPDLDFCGACRPALGVGGDYYDFLALPQGKLGIALGDVSGKGIAAALMMASLQASLRAEASRGTDDLGALIQKVNHLLHDTTAENRYATFFYAQYDPAARRLNYVNAGHNPPMLLRKSDRRTDVIRFEIGGTVIGLFEHFAFEQGTVTLDAGDLFVAFTDGITETMNPADEEWGETNLIRTLQGCDGLTASEIIPNVMDAADGFAAGAKQHDDMTLVVLRLTADQHH